MRKKIRNFCSVWWCLSTSDRSTTKTNANANSDRFNLIMSKRFVHHTRWQQKHIECITRNYQKWQIGLDRHLLELECYECDCLQALRLSIKLSMSDERAAVRLSLSLYLYMPSFPLLLQFLNYCVPRRWNGIFFIGFIPSIFPISQRISAIIIVVSLCSLVSHLFRRIDFSIAKFETHNVCVPNHRQCACVFFVNRAKMKNWMLFHTIFFIGVSCAQLARCSTPAAAATSRYKKGNTAHTLSYGVSRITSNGIYSK